MSSRRAVGYTMSPSCCAPPRDQPENRRAPTPELDRCCLLLNHAFNWWPVRQVAVRLVGVRGAWPGSSVSCPRSLLGMVLFSPRPCLSILTSFFPATLVGNETTGKVYVVTTTEGSYIFQLDRVWSLWKQTERSGWRSRRRRARLRSTSSLSQCLLQRNHSSACKVFYVATDDETTLMPALCQQYVSVAFVTDHPHSSCS